MTERHPGMEGYFANQKAMEQVGAKMPNPETLDEGDDETRDAVLPSEKHPGDFVKHPEPSEELAGYWDPHATSKGEWLGKGAEAHERVSLPTTDMRLAGYNHPAPNPMQETRLGGEEVVIMPDAYTAPVSEDLPEDEDLAAK